MRSKLRSIGAKLGFAALAALISVPLAAWTDGILLHLGLLSPGMYIWRLLHPHPQPGFLVSLGSGLTTMMVIDSSCWFALVWVAGYMMARRPNRKDVGGPEAPSRK